MTKLIALNEIVGAVQIPTLSNEEVSALKADPVSYLASALKADVQIDMALVENSPSEVHLALPYYAALNDMNAEKLNDESLAEISGGEIFISIGVACGIGIGFGVAAVAGTVGTATFAIVGAFGVAGGLIGGAIGATIIHAGVNAGNGKDIHGNKK